MLRIPSRRSRHILSEPPFRALETFPNQRIFRGFRGRVFARRWALKRAEVEALKSVLHEAANNIQRVYRGHLGRVAASEVRELGAVRKRTTPERKPRAVLHFSTGSEYPPGDRNYEAKDRRRACFRGNLGPRQIICK